MRSRSLFVRSLTVGSVLLACLLVSDRASAQTDPGPRTGPAGAGTRVAGLTLKEQKFFDAGLDAFTEVSSVTGSVPGTEEAPPPPPARHGPTPRRDTAWRRAAGGSCSVHAMIPMSRLSVPHETQIQTQPRCKIQNAIGGATAIAATLDRPQYAIPSARRRTGTMFVRYAADADNSPDQKMPWTMTSASIRR